MSWTFLPHQILSTVTVAGISLVLFFWIGRLLGSEAFGAWNVVLTWATIGMLAVDGGFRVLIYREGSGGSLSGRILDLAFGHWMALAVLSILGFGFFSFFLPGESVFQIWGALAFVLMNVIVVYRSSWLKASGNFREDAVWQVQCRVFSALAIIAVLLFKANAALIFWAWAFGLMICLGSVRGWLASIRPRPGFTLSVYRPVAALLLIDAATILYFRADILLLEWLGVFPGEIGQYAIAAKVLEGISLLSMPVSVIFFRQVRIQWLDHTWTSKAIRPVLLMAAAAGAGLVLAGFIAGEKPWIWLLGMDYAGVGGVLPWLLAATLFMLPNALLTQVILATHGEWRYAQSALLAAGANILLNLWWIPRWGIHGAAAATLIAEGLLMAGLLTWNRKQTPLISAGRENTP